jgi:thioredoxin reductase
VLACVTNPLLGRPDEAGWSAARSKSPRKLLVVGGGVAGLSAAGALARRGHKVTLIERSDALGGLASWQAQLPGRAEVGKAVDHLAAEALAAGAQIRTGTEARLDVIAAEAPHAVIVATGARAGAPLVACREVHVADLVAETGALLAGRAAEGTAILFDRTQTEATYAAAELLAERYDRLIILSPRLGFATESALVSLPGIHRRLTAAGVEILTGAEPVSMEGRVLRWRSSWSGRISELPGINAFIHADARIATDNLVAAVEQIAIPAWAIGDALAPRNLLTAIHDGFSAAEEVERLLASSLETPHPTPARPVAA